MVERGITMTTTAPECPAGHGPMALRPLKGQTPEQRWCGAWYDCQSNDYGARCYCSTLVPSEELKDVYRKAGVILP